MADYKTYAKEKRLYFAFSVIAYFLPFITVTACLMPLMKKSDDGLKVAVGLAIIFINALPFLQGVLEHIFSHFPMINTFALIYVCISAFFTFDIFQRYCAYFNWIELSAVIGSFISCILWAKYRKYADYNRTMKATVKSGAFIMKGEDK